MERNLGHGFYYNRQRGLKSCTANRGWKCDLIREIGCDKDGLDAIILITLFSSFNENKGKHVYFDCIRSG